MLSFRLNLLLNGQFDISDSRVCCGFRLPQTERDAHLCDHGRTDIDQAQAGQNLASVDDQI